MARAALFRGVGRVSELEMVRGTGAWITTSCGRTLLDFTSGIGVVNTGHCHPKVVAAVQSQAGELMHGQVNLGYHTPMLQLVNKLLPHLPQGLDALFFATTGAEAVENAVKLARQATGKPNVIVFQGSYHGRSFGTMPLTTSKTVYRSRFGPFMPGIFVSPFPYSHRGISVSESLAAFELLLQQQTTPDEVCAALIEPVLGEGGYVPAPLDFMHQLASLCQKHGILLIADEVQSGFGRTGELFAINGHYGITPDILVMAKGLASGMPLSAVATRKELADMQPPGSMGGTYAGNAVACAAARATLEVIEEEGLVTNAGQQGVRIQAALQDMADSGKYPISDVRGLGLMIGIELDASVPPGTASAISSACLDNGLMLLTTSVFETLRFIPPLTLTRDEADEGIARFRSALNSVFPT